jgi:hypothetical protein
MIKNEVPASFRATLSYRRIKITTGVCGVHEFDNEAVALGDSALREHDSGDDGSRPAPAGQGPVRACISGRARLMVGEQPRRQGQIVLGWSDGI